LNGATTITLPPSHHVQTATPFPGLCRGTTNLLSRKSKSSTHPSNCPDNSRTANTIQPKQPQVGYLSLSPCRERSFPSWSTLKDRSDGYPFCSSLKFVSPPSLGSRRSGFKFLQKNPTRVAKGECTRPSGELCKGGGPSRSHHSEVSRNGNWETLHSLLPTENGTHFNLFPIN